MNGLYATDFFALISVNDQAYLTERFCRALMVSAVRSLASIYRQQKKYDAAQMLEAFVPAKREVKKIILIAEMTPHDCV